MAPTLFILIAFSISCYFLLFVFSSFREHEKRATIIAVTIFLGVIFSSILVLLLSPVAFFLAVDVLLVGTMSLLFFPLGKKSALRIVGEKSRYDERHIMFARSMYVPGSRRYADYYQQNPEKKNGDDAVRSKPQLMEPGGICYEPIGAKIAESNFMLTEKMIPLCSGNPAPEKVHSDPLDTSRTLKKMARSLGAVDVRTTELDLQHIYSHVGRRLDEYGAPIHLDHTHVLVFAVEMDFDALQSAPKMPVAVESSKQYLEAAKIAIAVASYIRSFGYNARAHTDGNYLLPLPAVASDAGLGEMGRIGYLIHPTYGARIRLGAVTTDMPLEKDEPRVFGVQDFCRVCKKCAAYCPAGAISHGNEKKVRGVRKWSTNQQACYTYWRTVGTDCGICMRVCPYSKPNNFTHNVIRLMIRQNNVARRAAALGDKILYKY